VSSDELLLPDCLEADLASLLLLRAPIDLSTSQVQQLSPAALAYVGDAVYELYVRQCHLFPPKRLATYHRQVVAQVRAETQAEHLQSLQPHLTDPELDLLKRGRNGATSHPKRLNPEVYQRATSLETLIGYLYLTDPHRLRELLSYLKFDSPSETL
jgi:ribonuclease III family protein